MTAAPLITVVIPTRERCDVLASALRTVTSQCYENLRIMVSDNCSTDATADVVRRENDSRITYLNTGRRLSMSANWEFALSHVDEGWVAFMGDDDGLMPDAIAKVAALIQATQALVIRSRTVIYDWPGVGGNAQGQLVVPLSSGIEWRSTGKWLAMALRGEVGYAELPMLYSGGFIHISVLQHIREKAGAYFCSMIPDIYSAVAVSREVDDYLYSHEPFFIGGTSRHSTGNSSFSKSPQRNDQPSAVFASEGNLPIHPALPLSAEGGFPASLQLCLYESFLQSHVLGGREGVSADHASQLEIILATSGKHRAAIEEWGGRFARQHGLDVARALQGAARRRPYLQSLAWVRKLLRTLNAVVTDELPVRNVAEAATAAAVVRAAPGRLSTWRFLLRRLAALFSRC